MGNDGSKIDNWCATHTPPQIGRAMDMTSQIYELERSKRTEMIKAQQIEYKKNLWAIQIAVARGDNQTVLRNIARKVLMAWQTISALEGQLKELDTFISNLHTSRDRSIQSFIASMQESKFTKLWRKAVSWIGNPIEACKPEYVFLGEQLPNPTVSEPDEETVTKFITDLRHEWDTIVENEKRLKEELLEIIGR